MQNVLTLAGLGLLIGGLVLLGLFDFEGSGWAFWPLVVGGAVVLLLGQRGRRRGRPA